MIKNKYYLLALILLYPIKVTFAQENFEYQDRAYFETIKTVQLYPAGDPAFQTLYPVINRASRQQLMLEFDEVFEDAFSYLVKIIHCNNDWQPSGLSALQYLDEYNEFRIDEMEYSFGTKSLMSITNSEFQRQKSRVISCWSFILKVIRRK